MNLRNMLSSFDCNYCQFNSDEGLVWFGLLFNGISTFVDYLMPNLFKKNSSGTI